MKPVHGALDVTASGSAAADKERLVRLRGRCQHTGFVQNVTRRLLKSSAYKEKKALTPFVMSFYITAAFERSRLSGGIVPFSTYDPVNMAPLSIPVPCMNCSNPKCIHVSQVSLGSCLLILVNVMKHFVKEICLSMNIDTARFSVYLREY